MRSKRDWLSHSPLYGHFPMGFSHLGERRRPHVVTLGIKGAPMVTLQSEQLYPSMEGMIEAAARAAVHRFQARQALVAGDAEPA